MLKVRVKEGMPEGFIGFYNNPDGSGKRRRCGFEGEAGEEFELVDLMEGPEKKRVVAVEAKDTFSSKWMEFWDGKDWIDHIPEKKRPGPKKKPVLEDTSEEATEH